ncbi:MAG: hypothetical protein HY235_22495 [Acidobacteria bacterium]|nr:hypothetical protein [Acidobacteriota bacterium]
MKMICSFLLLAVSLFGLNPELAKVKSVYVLAMSNAMDQYLANRLQVSSLYVVVADPNTADAVFTDSLGPAFERKMIALYPPQKEETEEEAKPEEGRIVSSHKGRGMFFLVDRRTRQVLWSAHQLPRNYTPKELDEAARKVTERLRKELQPAAK